MKKNEKNTIPMLNNNFCFRKTTFYYQKVMYNNLKMSHISKKIIKKIVN